MVNSDFFSSNQYIFLYFISNSSLFFLTCSFHLSLASRFIPRYLTVFAYWISLLCITSLLIFLFVKLTWTNLVSFNFIRDVFIHVLIFYIDFWSFLVDNRSSMLSSVAKSYVISKCGQCGFFVLWVIACIQQIKDRSKDIILQNTSFNIFQF